MLFLAWKTRAKALLSTTFGRETEVYSKAPAVISARFFARAAVTRKEVSAGIVVERELAEETCDRCTGRVESVPASISDPETKKKEAEEESRAEVEERNRNEELATLLFLEWLLRTYLPGLPANHPNTDPPPPDPNKEQEEDTPSAEGKYGKEKDRESERHSTNSYSLSRQKL